MSAPHTIRKCRPRFNEIGTPENISAREALARCYADDAFGRPWHQLTPRQQEDARLLAAMELAALVKP